MKTFYQVLVNSLMGSVVNFTVWFAITFYAFLQTHSVFVTGMVSGMFLIFTALSGIWFGSIVDHNKKKTVMIISAAASLFFFTIGLVLYRLIPHAYFADQYSPYLWLFVFVLMLGVIVSNIRGIALPTLVTLLIPESKRAQANGLVGTTNGVSFLVTSVISGLLVGSSGMLWVLIIAIVVNGLSILHLLFVPIDEKVIVHIHAQDEQHPGTSKVDIKGTIRVVSKVSGLFPLIFFTMVNNFLGGVFMALMDAYGLSLISVQAWGLLWGLLSTGFIVGGIFIAKYGLGKNPLKSLFIANFVIWSISTVFTLYPSIILLGIGMFIYLCVVPFIEASEHTIIQKVVPPERQGRVFGFAQSVEQSASPLMALIIGPLTQAVFIPFMTTGSGVNLIGNWFGTGPDRGIALVFTLTGLVGFGVTLMARNSRFYHLLAKQYLK